MTYFSFGALRLTWQAKLACTETRLVSGLPMWRSGNATPDPRTSEGVFSFRKQVADQVAQIKKPTPLRDGLFHLGRLAVTYFRAGNPHYHRRRGVSPSCSGWEGVGPPRYGRQAKLVEGEA